MVLRGTDPAEAQVRTELWSQAAVDPVLQVKIAETVRSRRIRLAAFATRGAAAGQMVEVPANAFGAILVALVDGLLLHHSVDPSGFRWENISKVVDIIFDKLAAEPGYVPGAVALTGHVAQP
jgi:hypothetical protein